MLPYTTAINHTDHQLLRCSSPHRLSFVGSAESVSDNFNSISNLVRTRLSANFYVNHTARQVLECTTYLDILLETIGRWARTGRLPVGATWRDPEAGCLHQSRARGWITTWLLAAAFLVVAQLHGFRHDFEGFFVQGDSFRRSRAQAHPRAVADLPVSAGRGSALPGSHESGARRRSTQASRFTSMSLSSRLPYIVLPPG